MNIEGLWYQDYDRGRPPKCNRVIQTGPASPNRAGMPWRNELGLAFGVAIDHHRQLAGYRSFGADRRDGRDHLKMGII